MTFPETSSHIAKTFDNMRSSFTKRQDMFPGILALCFILKMSCITLFKARLANNF